METPEFFQGSDYYNTQFTYSNTKPGDNFIIEDLLDFPNDEVLGSDDCTFNNLPGNSGDSSTVTAIDSCNSSFSGNEPHFSGDIGCRNFIDGQFSDDLCVPYDDLAELEWLSNFVEESFSSEDMQKLQLISGIKAQSEEPSQTHQFQPENNKNNAIFDPDMMVPGKARSKRSRAAPCNWTSRLLVLAPPPVVGVPQESDKKTIKAPPKKKEPMTTTTIGDGSGTVNGSDGRRCLHCATDKTPQWRTGPMGPKTLCNACGVRYKSGRLVPEYRPAASPTFMLTKHSNSHRKVLELRRQKEAQHHHHHHQFLHQNMMFDVSNGDDYLIHQQIGPNYHQMI